MEITSPFQNVGQTFRAAFPFGTTFTDAQLKAWAREAGGQALAPDLAVLDEKKALRSLRTHLNDGGRANGLPSEDRFYIEVVDRVRGVYRTISLVEHVAVKAGAAFDKSLVQATNPLLSSAREIGSFDLDNLPEGDREILEQRLEEVATALKPIQEVYSAARTERWVNRLIARGHTREQAVTMLAMAPDMVKYTRQDKYLKAI